MKTLSEFLLKEQSERTRNQYASSWSQFLSFLKRMDISPDQVKEATVVNCKKKKIFLKDTVCLWLGRYRLRFDNKF